MAYDPYLLDPKSKLALKRYYDPYATEEFVTDEDMLNDQLFTKDGLSPMSLPQQMAARAPAVLGPDREPTQEDINAAADPDRELAAKKVAPPVQPVVEPKDPFLAHQENLSKELAPYLGGQKFGVDDLAALEQASSSGSLQNINLSPLLAMIDAERGTKIAQSYQSPQDRAMEQAKLKKGALDARGTVIDDITKAMGTNRDLAKQKSDEGRAAGRISGFLTGIEKESRAYTNKLDTTAAEFSGLYDKLEAAYKSGDVKKITSVLGAMAAAGGNKGATSDPDAARQLLLDYEVFKNSIKASIGIDGKIKPESLRSYVELIDSHRKTMGQTLKERYAAYKPDIENSYSTLAEVFGEGIVLPAKSRWEKSYGSKQDNVVKRFKLSEEKEKDADSNDKNTPTKPFYDSKSKTVSKPSKPVGKKSSFNLDEEFANIK